METESSMCLENAGSETYFVYQFENYTLIKYLQGLRTYLSRFKISLLFVKQAQTHRLKKHHRIN